MANNEKPAVEATGPEFSIQRIYLKDLSFESPNMPQLLRNTEWQPQIQFTLDVQHQPLTDDNHDVSLRLNITAKLKDQTAFIVEITQGGVFLMKNFPAADIEHIAKVNCAEILFPYAREKISETIGNGGFPPLYLAPLNFEGWYRQQKEQAKATAE